MLIKHQRQKKKKRKTSELEKMKLHTSISNKNIYKIRKSCMILTIMEKYIKKLK